MKSGRRPNLPGDFPVQLGASLAKPRPLRSRPALRGRGVAQNEALPGTGAVQRTFRVAARPPGQACRTQAWAWRGFWQIGHSQVVQPGSARHLLGSRDRERASAKQDGTVPGMPPGQRSQAVPVLLRLPHHSGHKGPVHAVGMGEQFPGTLQLELWVPAQEFVHRLDVFLRLQAACAVNQGAARL